MGKDKVRAVTYGKEDEVEKEGDGEVEGRGEEGRGGEKEGMR